MRTFLLITTSILLALFLISGCSKGSSPTTPDQMPNVAISETEFSEVRSTQLAMFTYDVSIDFDTLDYNLEQVVTRSTLAIGDSFEVEIGKYMTGWYQGIQCMDCLQIVNIGLYGNGDVLLDVRMKHPFDSSWYSIRRDLDVFDPRLICLVDGTDTRFSLTQGVGISNEPIMGNFEFLINADGYTNHFNNRSEIPEFIGTPRGYRGNLNPYKDYFVDTDPSPIIYGKENPNRRMRMGDGYDIQRLRLRNPGPGSTVEFLFVVEVSYVQSATRPTRLSPVYHLPEGNRKEAYRIQTSLPRTIVEGDTTPLNFSVYVEDWQNSTPTGPLTDQVRAQSDVAGITVEIPGVSSTLATQILPVSGSGVMYDPYVFNIVNMPVDMNPTQAEAPYLALIAVEDQLNGTLRADVYYDLEPLDDFVAYKTYPINVIAPGTCPEITIYNHSVNTGQGTCIISGEIKYLDQTSNPTITHGKLGEPSTYRTYPLNVDFDGSFTTTVVLFIGSNEISFNANNQFCDDSESLPIINYSPSPPFPRFRVTLFWQPHTPDPLDSTDMDIHMWFAEGALLENSHCFYDRRNIGNINNGYLVLNLDDPDGYGPENTDGRDGTDGMRQGFYPIAVNYYSNHRGLTTHRIDFKVRILLNPGTIHESLEEWPPGEGNFYYLTRENFNSISSYPVTESTDSWFRVRDIQVDANGIASTVPPDTNRELWY